MIEYLEGKELRDAKNQANDCMCDPMGRENDAVGICSECACIVDDDGDACVGCSYSPEDCGLCGSRPCDGSC